ncbi:MAG: hypothetical protein AB8B92_09090 [Gammaproteobacteria bacterium]
MLILLQTLLYLIGILFTGYLLVEGWLNQAVWVKGCSKGLFASVTEMESWAAKKHRSSEPQDYWGFMGFYCVAFMFFLIVLIF